VIFDPDDGPGAHALARLARERMAWLTTVTPQGQPETMPIWFLWVDGELLVYGDYRARRNANLAANPRVSLHLPDDGSGGDIVVIEGVARFDPGYPQAPDNPAYLAKYGAWIERFVGGPARMAQTYNLPIFITPTRAVCIPG
jgi:PPOX class probable F420-dependent enzyme